MRSVLKAGLFAALTLTFPFAANAADPVAAAAADAAPAATTIPEGKARESYMIGAQIGTQLRSSKIDIDLEVFMTAIKAALANEKLALSEAEMMATSMALNERIQKAAQAEAAEAVNKNTAEGKKFLEENGKKEGVVTTATGLQYKVLSSGPADGKSPTNENKVLANYEGKLINGTVFDSSLGKKPIEFGVTGVIPGWTEALKLMKPGDKWELYIPSELAYGERGAGGDIGPNATLIFFIELVEVK